MTPLLSALHALKDPHWVPTAARRAEAVEIIEWHIDAMRKQQGIQSLADERKHYEDINTDHWQSMRISRKD